MRRGKLKTEPTLPLAVAIGVPGLAGRAYSRDYVDTAALLRRWTPAELIGFARRLDPGLDSRDLGDVALRLDRIPDTVFIFLGLSTQDIARSREQFADWPRT